MMRLAELAAVPAAVLPLAELAEQLRLPGGFPADGSLDAKLEACLRAAMTTVEARTGKALLERGFLWQIADWAGSDCQPLPIAPVARLDAITLVLRDGSTSALDVADYRIAPDTHRPQIMPLSGVLPAVVQGGQVDIAFTAGFGAAWADVPGDLREAVLMLAADYFDQPINGAARLPGLPPVVQVLIESHRDLGLRRIGK